eukprot:SAG31_NODE_4757_length_2975_cov_1.244437_1_plen_424_part_10
MHPDGINDYLSIEFGFDGGLLSGGWTIYDFQTCDEPCVFTPLPNPAFLGFTARTGGATNNHWVRGVSISRPPAPPLSTPMPIETFALSGDAQVTSDYIQLTDAIDSQNGQAFSLITINPADPFVVRYWLLTGAGTGADGQCVNVGGNDLQGRAGEDGVAQGLAVCFDEYANNGDDGISIFYNSGVAWENTSPCANREGCIPVSLFDGLDNPVWHLVEITLEPQAAGAMKIRLDLDNGEYTGEATVEGFALPSPTFLGFTGRTGGLNNEHFVRAVSTGTHVNPIEEAAVVIPHPPSHAVEPSRFTLGGDASVADGVLQLTMAVESQNGQAWYPLDIDESDSFHVQFSLYSGDGSGADGMCVNLGDDDLGGRSGEDGVAAGLALCFDEWSSDGDHGISIFYNGAAVWEELANCGNRQGCEPVSLFE